jgi:hypothetical protein
MEILFRNIGKKNLNYKFGSSFGPNCAPVRGVTEVVSLFLLSIGLMDNASKTL